MPLCDEAAAAAIAPDGDVPLLPRPLPPLHPLAPNRAARRLGRRLTRFTELGLALWALSVQLLIWHVMGPGLAPHAHWHQAAMVLIEAAYLLALLLLPEPLWLQHRVTMLGAARIAAGLVPCSRSATEGTAVLLQRTATEGWGGGLLDWLRVGGGTRLLVHAGCGALLKMPLLALLAQQGVMMALSANPAGYCATPLLAHPLTRRRLHRLWVAFEATPTVVPYTTDFTPASKEEAAQAECMALLTMQQVVVGILLPLAVALTVHSSGREEPPQRATQHAQQAHQAAWQPRWLHGVRAAAAAGHRVWAGANDMLTAALDFDGDEMAVSVPQLLLCVWLLLGNAWLLCKAAAIRHLLSA